MTSGPLTGVVFDYRYAGFPQTGMGKYAMCLGKELSQQGVTLLALRNQTDLPAEQVIYTDRPWSALRLGRDETARLRSCTAFIEPTWFCPINIPLPVFVTVHDLIPLEFGSLKHLLYFKLLIRYYIRPKAILTISQYSANKLEALYRGTPVRVVGVGIDAPYRRDVAQLMKAEVRVRFNLPSRYLLYVGANLRHKNLEFVDALAQNVDCPIVAVGSRLETRVFASRNIMVLPPVPEELLPGLYGGAKALLLPSLYEGYGLPAMEALACGIPALVSDRGALPSTVGSYGQVIPLEVSEWVRAIRDLRPVSGIPPVPRWGRVADEVLCALAEQGLMTR